MKKVIFLGNSLRKTSEKMEIPAPKTFLSAFFLNFNPEFPAKFRFKKPCAYIGQKETPVSPKKLDPENSEGKIKISGILSNQANRNRTAPAISCEISGMKRNPAPEIQKSDPEIPSYSGKYQNPDTIRNILKRILPGILREKSTDIANSEVD